MPAGVDTLWKLPSVETQNIARVIDECSSCIYLFPPFSGVLLFFCFWRISQLRRQRNDSIAGGWEREKRTEWRRRRRRRCVACLFFLACVMLYLPWPAEIVSVWRIDSLLEKMATSNAPRREQILHDFQVKYFSTSRRNERRTDCSRRSPHWTSKMPFFSSSSTIGNSK